MNDLTRICAVFAAVGACCSALTQRLPCSEFDRNVKRNALPGVPLGFEVSFLAREALVRQPCPMAFEAAHLWPR